MSEKRYWHCYGAVTEDFGGCWALITVESTLPGDEMPKELTNGFPYLGDFGGSWALITVESALPGDEMPKELTNGFPYLASFDHEPTDSEKDALAPYRYRDDQEAAR